MKNHDSAEQLALNFSTRDLNEANTRHQLIDPLLHDVLGWPRNRVLCEEFIKPGFADYLLVRPDKTPILFIEAKREGKYFEIPQSLIAKGSFAYIKVSTLLTDETSAAAINQVREYCLTSGCEYAAVTNGRQWIFFKTFQVSQDWRDLRAFVVSNLEYFSKHFVEAHNHFSFEAIVENASLRRLFLDGTIANRELFYPKDKIDAYDVLVDSNQYASSLRPIADKYFGAIDPHDAQFMEHCYVSDREYDTAFVNAKRRIEDAITPFLKQFDIRDFRANDKGGSFGTRISKSLTGVRPADVVVLFGGKGVGKSTFLRRLLIHRPPHVIEKNGIVVLIDLLDVAPNREDIQLAIWNGIAQALDTDEVLNGPRDGLCELFGDRYSQAMNQELYGLDPASETYNLKLNQLIADWKREFSYVTKRLAERARARHKAVVINIDNTDQYPSELQELCFTLARSIAATFPCVVIISMREERFYSSSIRGVLDAYQNSGFHITAPEPKQVFRRRLRYVLDLVRSDKAGESNELPEYLDHEVIGNLVRILDQNLDDPASHLEGFLTACSHGNIRLALELFRGFLVSGYTNVREMTSGPRWTLQIHQVIKPFMVPSRFFYSESLSRIPNIFQIRSKTHGSHFTALRILDALQEGYDARNPPFIPVARLALPFIETFGMKEDFLFNMEVLMKHSLIEANNRLDSFDAAVDSVKITAYGSFVLGTLADDFTYLELTASDSAISDLSVANEIAQLSNDEYKFFYKRQSMERVNVRLRRADVFLSYLAREEKREHDFYRSGANFGFTRDMQAAFDVEREKVLASAARNIPRKRHYED